MTVTQDPDAVSGAAAVVAPIDISTLEKGTQEVAEPAQDKLLVGPRSSQIYPIIDQVQLHPDLSSAR